MSSINYKILLDPRGADRIRIYDNPGPTNLDVLGGDLSIELQELTKQTAKMVCYLLAVHNFRGVLEQERKKVYLFAFCLARDE